MSSTHSHFTLEQVANFCYENRKYKGFKNFTYEEIALAVVEAAHGDSLTVVFDDSGICGACIYTVGTTCVYVNHIVSVRGGFRTLVAEFFKRFGNKQLTGRRGNTLRKFNKRLLWAMQHQALAAKPDKSYNHSSSMLQMP